MWCSNDALGAVAVLMMAAAATTATTTTTTASAVVSASEGRVLVPAAAAAFVSSSRRRLARRPHTALAASSSSSRVPLICGNWKLNPTTKTQAVELATDIANAITPDTPCQVGLFVPFCFLETVQNIAGNAVAVGAQTTTPQPSGAYTGGISPVMVQSLGCEWALAGHSERRRLYGETDQDIHQQCRLLIERGMKVLLCIGETREEYDLNLVADILELQLTKALAGMAPSDIVDHVVIAYEPVWAIGTGKVATPQQAQEVHAQIRTLLAQRYTPKLAQKMRLLYGGSVSPTSIDGLLAQPDIDGALVGGASLDAEQFGRIIHFHSNTNKQDDEEEETATVGRIRKWSRFLSRLWK